MGVQWGGGRGERRSSDNPTMMAAGALLGGLLTLALFWSAGWIERDEPARVEVVTPGDVDAEGEGELLTTCQLVIEVRETRAVVRQGECDG